MDLNNSTISRALMQKFKANKASLSKNAFISVKKPSNRWLITDFDPNKRTKNRTYTIRKKGDKLHIYSGGIRHAVHMTGIHLKRFLWWTFADISSSGWGKFGGDDFLKIKWRGKTGRKAFLTYFVHVPALLGLLLLWGNRKRHMIWIISGPLILFVSVYWHPIHRYLLPIICLMMALGWATYFVILRLILRLMNWLIRKCGEYVRPRTSLSSSNQEQKRMESKSFTERFVSSVKGGFSLDMATGFMVCCLAMQVVIFSTESILRSIKETAIHTVKDRKSGWTWASGSRKMLRLIL